MKVKRFIVVGTTGSGKTTLAGQLSERLHVPHVELDALNWGPDWTARPHEEFQALVRQATSGDAWVVCVRLESVRGGCVVWVGGSWVDLLPSELCVLGAHAGGLCNGWGASRI